MSLENLSVISDIEQSQNQNMEISQISYIDNQICKSEQNAEYLKEQIQIVLMKIRNQEKSIFQIVSGSRNLNNQHLKQSSKAPKRNLLHYIRKEKSLEELSKRFLKLFIDQSECLICLDQITSQLGVERRRIYDIINILESLKLVNRKGKNNYKWNGFSQIYDTINEYLNQNEDSESIKAPINIDKREKSLEQLSVGFLKLFLHWRNVISLEDAARKLSNYEIDEHKIKTKIRRLYDIANVFKSLGLIKKTIVQSTRKPAFLWVGQSGLDGFTSQMKYESLDKISKSLDLSDINPHTNSLQKSFSQTCPPSQKQSDFTQFRRKYNPNVLEDSVLNFTNMLKNIQIPSMVVQQDAKSTEPFNEGQNIFLPIYQKILQDNSVLKQNNSAFQQQKPQNYGKGETFFQIAQKFMGNKENFQTAKKNQQSRDENQYTPQIKKALTIIYPRRDSSASSNGKNMSETVLKRCNPMTETQIELQQSLKKIKKNLQENSILGDNLVMEN